MNFNLEHHLVITKATVGITEPTRDIDHVKHQARQIGLTSRAWLSSKATRKGCQDTIIDSCTYQLASEMSNLDEPRWDRVLAEHHPVSILGTAGASGARIVKQPIWVSRFEGTIIFTLARKPWAYHGTNEEDEQVPRHWWLMPILSHPAREALDPPA